MFISNVIAKFTLLNLLTTFSALKLFFRAVFIHVCFQISLLDCKSTVKGAACFIFVYDFLKAFVFLKVSWKVSSALWTTFWVISELFIANFADDRATLFAVCWNFWKIKTNDALKELKRELLLLWLYWLLLLDLH